MFTVVYAKDNITYVIDTEEFAKGGKNLYLLFQGHYYDPRNKFNSIEAGRKGLPAPVIERAAFHKNAAEKALEKMRHNYDGVPMPGIVTAPAGGESGGLGGKLEELFFKTVAEASTESIFKEVYPVVRKRLIDEFGFLPQRHEIVTPNAINKITGVTHEKFDDVLTLVSAAIPVFLAGPAGTGKNVLAQQVAAGLGLNFYFTNAVTQEYKLTGFIDANGHYHETAFYKAFKDGGLFFLDEMDGSIPEVLIILNAAIANGYFDFPTGQVTAHEDFRVIAAGNTYGTGADIEYTGRYQLDAASLDRYALMEIDYSPKIEEAVANGNNELITFIHDFRKAVQKAHIHHLATYRAIERIAKLEGTMDIKTVLNISLLKGLSTDDRNIIANDMEYKSNKYYKALKACI